jgi:hypothetical protein
MYFASSRQFFTSPRRVSVALSGRTEVRAIEDAKTRDVNYLVGTRRQPRV